MEYGWLNREILSHLSRKGSFLSKNWVKIMRVFLHFHIFTIKKKFPLCSDIQELAFLDVSEKQVWCFILWFLKYMSFKKAVPRSNFIIFGRISTKNKLVVSKLMKTFKNGNLLIKIYKMCFWVQGFLIFSKVQFLDIEIDIYPMSFLDNNLSNFSLIFRKRETNT